MQGKEEASIGLDKLPQFLQTLQEEHPDYLDSVRELATYTILESEINRLDIWFQPITTWFELLKPTLDKLVKYKNFTDSIAHFADLYDAAYNRKNIQQIFSIIDKQELWNVPFMEWWEAIKLTLELLAKLDTKRIAPKQKVAEHEVAQPTLREQLAVKDIALPRQEMMDLIEKERLKEITPQVASFHHTPTSTLVYVNTGVAAMGLESLDTKYWNEAKHLIMRLVPSNKPLGEIMAMNGRFFIPK